MQVLHSHQALGGFGKRPESEKFVVSLMMFFRQVIDVPTVPGTTQTFSVVVVLRQVGFPLSCEAVGLAKLLLVAVRQTFSLHRFNVSHKSSYEYRSRIRSVTAPNSRIATTSLVRFKEHLPAGFSLGDQGLHLVFLAGLTHENYAVVPRNDVMKTVAFTGLTVSKFRPSFFHQSS
jgi:hypothetical protein